MTRALSLGVLAVVIASSASANQIINISSFSHRISSPLEIALDAGTYTLMPITQAEGGQFTAWNTWNSGQVTGCSPSGINCAHGWLWSYSISSPSLGDVEVPATIVDGTTGVYSNRDLAFASRSTPFQFTLDQPETLSFFMRDGPSLYIDNVGGVSLQLVPEPGTASLLAAGLLLLTSHRRRVQGAGSTGC
jgi:hypothetical protein